MTCEQILSIFLENNKIIVKNFKIKYTKIQSYIKIFLNVYNKIKMAIWFGEANNKHKSNIICISFSIVYL